MLDATIISTSLSRLRNTNSIKLFKEIFAIHGVLGVSKKLGNKEAQEYSEIDRLIIAPLVFGLIPSQALARSSISDPIKDTIKRHLNCIGIQHDSDLIDIIKEISDQFYQSKVDKNYKKTKQTLPKVIQAYRNIYEQKLEYQFSRCIICGLNFNNASTDIQDQPELDHCLPWYLVGDPPDGSNWQILCKRCNSAKSHWISSLQIPEALNWVYTKNISELIHHDPSSTSRYIVLAQRRSCEYPNCSLDHKNTNLFVVADTINSLSIVDHLKVYCPKHYRMFRNRN